MTIAPSILIVEDEPLISMMLEDFLDSLGYRIAGTADGVRSALDLISKADFDLAILDVNLRGGESSWPVADALADRDLPFILATGGAGSDRPGRHDGVPVLSKPFTMDGVKAAVEGLLA